MNKDMNRAKLIGPLCVASVGLVAFLGLEYALVHSQPWTAFAAAPSLAVYWLIVWGIITGLTRVDAYQGKSVEREARNDG